MTADRIPIGASRSPIAIGPARREGGRVVGRERQCPFPCWIAGVSGPPMRRAAHPRRSGYPRVRSDPSAGTRPEVYIWSRCPSGSHPGIVASPQKTRGHGGRTSSPHPLREVRFRVHRQEHLRRPQAPLGETRVPNLGRCPTRSTKVAMPPFPNREITSVSCRTQRNCPRRPRFFDLMCRIFRHCPTESPRARRHRHAVAEGAGDFRHRRLTN